MHIAITLVLLAPTAGSPKPAETTVSKLLAKAHPAGALVDVAAVTLPESAIRVKAAGGKNRYFALAVAKDGAYLAQVARTLEEVRAAAPEAQRALEAAVDDDAKYKAQADVLDKLLDRVYKLTPPPAEAVAVELQGFDALSAVFDWESLTRPTAGAETATGGGSSYTVADQMSKLRKLASDWPPDLGKPLPRYAGPKVFRERAELRDHNKMVKLYNAELLRRRRYSAQRSGEALAVGLAALERVLASRDEIVRGTVAARDDSAGRAFEKARGGVPGAWLKEKAPKGVAVSDRYFARSSLLVASYPAGATLSVGGEALGATPRLVPDVAVGKELSLAFERTGFTRKQVAQKVEAVPAGVKRIEVALEPPTPAEDPPDEVWFVEGDGARITVGQEANVEWTSPDGKSKARPELILRCAAGEKEAYLFYPHGFGASEGDIFVRFENESKPKKFWGAPSQNGQSFFLTGFWGKGTDGLIKALLQHKTMSMTVKPKKREPLPELSLDLKGLDTALEGWLKACPLKK